MGVKSRVVHLVLSQGTQFPVGHLLTFAERFAKDLVDNLRKSNLILFLFHSLPILLNIQEASKLLEKLHLRERLLKHARVASKRKSDTQTAFIRENLNKLLIENRVVSQTNQIDDIGICLATELENGKALLSERLNIGAPLRVHSNHWGTDESVKQGHVRLTADEVQIHVGRHLVASLGDWSEYVTSLWVLGWLVRNILNLNDKFFKFGPNP